MVLPPGTRIGPYDIGTLLGAGAMGQVYRARDSKLNRDVALKVLPDAFANDPDRLARFTREAQTLAALNHPNIAHIHGLEDRALVMELVEGRDLSAIIGAARSTPGASPGMPLADALPVARQIADALEAAHDQGIVHRDLKPANIKVRADGTVKILDFGLAKAVGAADAAFASDPMSSPTQTASPTEQGVILGTVAYMAPEQARGRPVDRRADIWAFGVVLYEMLTGTRAFAGAGFPDVLAAVLRHEIDWSRVPPDTPPKLRHLLMRCLEPDPKQRLRDIGEARIVLTAIERGEDTAPPVTAIAQVRPGAPSSRREKLAWAIAVLAVVVAGTLAVQQMTAGDVSPGQTAGTVSRLSVLPPPGLLMNPDSTNIAISPNGRMVVFIVGTGTSAENQLWVRPLHSSAARRIEGGDGASLPFWSPDSDRIGFFARGQLKTVAAAGGPSQVVCSAPFGRGGAWNRSNVILFAPDSTGPLYRVPAAGGDPVAVTTVDTGSKETGHRFPVFVSGDDRFLYAALPGAGGGYQIFAGSLSDAGTKTLIGTMESAPSYVEPDPSTGSELPWLLFTRQGTAAAQQFDSRALRLVGDVVTLGDQPSVAQGPAAYDAGRRISASSTGSFAYFLGASGNTTVQWMDLAGKKIGTVAAPPAEYSAVAISPNGLYAALTRADSPTSSSLWLVDLTRPSAVPIWTGAGRNPWPAWSPDSARIVFTRDDPGRQGLYEKAVNGTAAETPLLLDATLVASSWSREGIIFSRVDPGSKWNLYRLQEGAAAATPLIVGPSLEISGQVSADGRWLTYISDEAGSADLYVQSLSGGAQKAQVATGGIPRYWWAPGSRALFYTKRDQTFWRVSVDFSGATPTVGANEQLASLPMSTVALDVAPDGKRLIALVPEFAGPGAVTVVQSWPAALPAVRR